MTILLKLIYNSVPVGLMLIWPISIYYAISVVFHPQQGIGEFVAGFFRGRIGVHYRDGFSQTVPGMHISGVAPPKSFADFGGEFYLEHYSGPDEWYGNISYIGIEVPIPFILIATAITMYLWVQKLRITVRSAIIGITLISIFAACYAPSLRNYVPN